MSGHSTFSALAAAVLSYLFPAGTNDFGSMANEASLSRWYGAIHYQSDCKEGLSLGKRVGAYSVNFGLADGAN